MRLLVNLAATFVLVILLVTPSVFSFNLVDFETGVSGIAIFDNSQKFGQFLSISKIGQDHFKLEFTIFSEKPALYQNFLEIENKKESKTIVRVINENSEVEIFFNKGSQNLGPAEIDLAPKQKIGLDLLVPANTQVETASFSLVSE